MTVEASGLRSDTLLIGLTGPFGSGCSSVVGALLAEWLGQSPAAKLSHVWPPKAGETRGPKNLVKLSDFVKEEANGRQSPPHNRGFMQDVGDGLRRQYGEAYLALRAIERATQVQEEEGPTLGFVFDGIRNPGEIREFRKYAKFFLVAVDAPISIRWERLKKPYNGDQRQFETDDERDHDELPDFGQKVQRCVDMADMVVKNYEPLGTLQNEEALEEKLRRFLDLVRNPGSWEPRGDEVHMNEAYTSSTRSTCLRRQVGAVVCDASGSNVGNGFNEVPNPDKDPSCRKKLGKCYRIQHPQAGSDRASVADCRAIHAEERALSEAYKHARDLAGGTLYTTTFPCDRCARSIALARIAKVVFVEPYPETTVNHVLEENGIKPEKFEGVKGQAYLELFFRPSQTVH